VSADEIRAAMDAEAAEQADGEPERAPLGPRIVGALVIVLLAAAVVALVVWGLAR
jgi:hypothetical protein